MLFIYIAISIITVITLTLFFALSPVNTITSSRLTASPLSEERLIESVREFAKTSVQAGLERGNGVSLAHAKKQIYRAQTIISTKSRSKSSLLPCEEAYLDNFYKVLELIDVANEGVNDLKKLPHHDGVPVVFSLCKIIIDGSGGVIDRKIVKKAVDEFNSYRPLKTEEAQAFLTAIAVALLGYVSAVATRLIAINRASRSAMEDAKAERVDIKRIKSPSYIVSLYNAFNEKNKRQLRSLCFDNGIDVDRMMENYYLSLSSLSSSLSVSLEKVRSLSDILSDEFLLTLCPLHEFLQKESLSYGYSTTATKDYYLKRIAFLSKKTGKNEFATARTLVANAQSSGKDLSEILLPKRKGNLAQRLLIAFYLSFSLFLSVATYFWLRSVLVSVLIFPLFIALTEKIFCAFLRESVQKRILPKKDLRYIEKDKKVNIICVRLIASVSEVKDAIKMLKAIAFANPNERFSYTLLVDFCGADSEEILFDGELIKALEDEFALLDDRFNLLIRKRERNVNGKFEGREKKRGAILDCFSLMLYGNRAPFRLAIGSSYKTEYALVLDSDTLLSSATELLCVMEHPYAKDTVVVSLNMKSSPLSSEKTLFSRIFSGANGISNYPSHNSDFVFDVFAEGNFTGKGMIRVKEFYEKTANAFRDGTILSHDFIEGAYCGTLNSDEEALDEFPPTFCSFFTRSLRWLRGDVQLLPFLKRKVKNKDGERVKNPITPISKWHIFINVISAILPVISLALIFISVLKNDNRILIFATIPFIVEVLLCPKNIVVQLCNLAFLPTVSVHSAYNFILTIIRLIRRKNLLVWQVFAHQKSKELTPLPSVITSFVLLILNLFLFGSFYIYGICLLFVLSVPLENLLALERTVSKKNESENSFLTLIATKTWQYFKHGCVSENNFLPPDNYCEEGDRGYAPRTSPTNIGMALTSSYCAYRLGVISKDEAQTFISQILTTLERMEKWHGNLYNWYDVKTLSVLYPRYVSSVDSGNFVCCLMLAKTVALDSDKERIEKLIDKSDLSAFYDKQKGLMRIGYNEMENRFDAHYDLKASESSILYLIAISLGQIPCVSWRKLSSRTLKYKKSTLVSWTGGAFEQLLCPQFFLYPKKSVLSKSANGMIDTQIRYAKRKGLIAFGISESQYGETYDNGDYKYKAFGISEIALSGEGKGDVVSPYASALSLPFSRFAVENLYTLYEKGMTGKYGFYESYDGEPIKSYMAHHQGMILLSICNYLCDNAVQNELLSLPEFTVSQLLLSDCSALKGKKKPSCVSVDKALLEEKKVACEYQYPTLGLFGRRDYRFLINERGEGHSFYGKNEVVRARENEGFFVLVNGKNVALSTTAIFSERGVLYQKKENGIVFSLQVSPLLRLDGESRTLKMKNESKETKSFSVSAKAEIVLGNHDADVSHREYYNMFVTSKILSDGIVSKREKENCYCSFTALGSAEFSYESNRATFYGRKKGVKNGETLDPIVSASCKVSVQPGEEITLAYYLTASNNYEKAIADLKTLRSSILFRASDDRGSFGPISAFSFAGKITSAVGTVKDSGLQQRFNLRYPIVALSFTSARAKDRMVAILNDLKSVYRYGVKFHTVILYDEQIGYYSPLCGAIEEAIETSEIRRYTPTGCAVISVNERIDKALYDSVKKNSIDLFGENRVIERSLFVKGQPYENASVQKPSFSLGYGENGFLSDGSFYIDLTKTAPKKPWSNVVSNGKIGTLMTESGGGYTFSANSGENKITEWSNDSVKDEPSEFVLLCERGNVWSVTASPIKKQADYYALHSFGYTKYGCNYNGFSSHLTCFLGNSNAKYYVLEVENATKERRILDVTFACKLTLGDFNERTKTAINVKKENNRLVATNVLSGQTVMLDCSETANYHAFSLRALKDNNGNYTAERVSFDSGSDFVYGVTLEFSKSEKKRVIFCLTENENYDFSIVGDLLKMAYKRYSSLSSVKIKTGNERIDFLYKWLPYQTLCSRFLGRTGFYQSSGAYGFRDQLQDCLALLYVNPALVRKHLIRCCGKQFIEGDVLHWWHEENGGVRTNIVDDRLFLPWVTSEYVDFTGDYALLTEKVEYLKSELIPFGQKSLYKKFAPSVEKESVLSHCLRAINSVELGKSGIPLMKGGDWNDAMDEVGEKGTGESVFLAMLLYKVIMKFARFVSGEKEKSELIKKATLLSESVEKFWDGEWYGRAITDEGVMLGSKSSSECKIDLLTQSFASLSGACNEKRVKTALCQAEEKLVDKSAGIIKLLSPPIKETKGVGYIADYPKGVRENGGQYTHCAIWFINALYEVGESEKAYKLFDMINPVTKGYDERYGLEPYVTSADIYSGERAGEGGWSWYTGSAGWTYKTLTEKMLGVTIRNRTLTLRPMLPKSVKEVKMKVTVCGNDAHITIDNSGEGEWTLYVGKVRFGEPTLTVNQKTQYEEITLKKE